MVGQTPAATSPRATTSNCFAPDVAAVNDVWM